jgi:hypothetical protein
MTSGEDILDVKFFFANETWFHLSSYISSHMWSATNPHEIKDTPLHDQKVGVWCAMSQNWIIGPMLFYDTIISECCCEMILYSFIGHLNEDRIAHSYFNRMVLLHT